MFTFLTGLLAYFVFSTLAVVAVSVTTIFDGNILKANTEVSWYLRPIPLLLAGGTMVLFFILFVLEWVDDLSGEAGGLNWYSFTLAPLVWAFSCLLFGNTGSMNEIDYYDRKD